MTTEIGRGVKKKMTCLEERIRVVRERCRLMADVFSIQAEATFLACHVSMSADAYNALTDMCRASADDLEQLAHDLPGVIANWCPPNHWEGDTVLGAGIGVGAGVGERTQESG